MPHRCRVSVQLARALPGTLVFFDKFCPELHRTSPGATNPLPGDDTKGTQDKNASMSYSTSSPGEEPSLLAACKCCRARLGSSSVITILSDEDVGDADSDSEVEQWKALRERGAGTSTRTRTCITRNADLDEDFWGISTVATATAIVRTLDLDDFVGEFVADKQAAAELIRRGALLRHAYIPIKVCG